MGMYCCCDQKIRDGWKCKCNWKGWISTGDFPEERKNKKTPIQKNPPEDGRYLVRVSTDCGDRYECEMNFSKIPFKTVKIGFYYPQQDYDVHWDSQDFDLGCGPYAWKKIEQADCEVFRKPPIVKTNLRVI